MARVKDQWTSPKRDASGKVVRNEKGKVVREPNKRWGKGKRWLAIWFNPDGVESSSAFKTFEAARTYANDQETDVRRDDYVDPKAGKVKFAEIGKRWLKTKATADPASVIQYESMYRLHVEPKWGKRAVNAIKPSEIAEWLAEFGERYSASRQRIALLVIQGVLDLAVADESIKKNPALSKVIPRPTNDGGQRVQAWPDKTVTAIIDAMAVRFQPIAVIAAGCGLRAGELFGLALEDFDVDEQVLHVRRQVKKLGKEYVYALPKYDKERTVPLPTWVVQIVDLHTDSFEPKPYTLAWERPTGKPHTANLLFRWPTDEKHVRQRNFDETVWKPALVTAGVIPPPTLDKRQRKRYITDRKTGIHSLRHYYASITLADGVNIRELAEYLGHSDPGFTLRVYSHLLPDSHERARKAIDSRMLRPRLVAAASNGAETEQSR